MEKETKKEIYISTDIELGPIPGPNSMLSFGSVAFTYDKTEVGSFTRNLETLPGASGNPDTMKWWGEDKQRAAWEACRKNPVPPKEAMVQYVEWVKGLGGSPVFVAYPAGFDFLFMYWYLIAFAGESPFSFSALDVKSYAKGVLKRPYRECTKRNFPNRWFPKTKHNHVAIDDAREQGLMFMNMMCEHEGPPNPR